jgi:hypothetical protein
MNVMAYRRWNISVNKSAIFLTVVARYHVYADGGDVT